MPRVWLNGSFLDGDAAAIEATDRGFTLGDGIFDTGLVLSGTMFRRAQHVDRLMAALEVVEIPASRETLEAAMDAMAPEIVDGSVRVTVTRGPGARGLRYPSDPRPTVLATATPLAPSMMFAKIRCAVSETRRNETSPLSRLKSLSYLDAILASRRAEREGASEALFLNGRGMAACSSLANLFVVEGFDLVTPPLRDGAMPGILRGWVLENAEDYGLRPIERSVPQKSLASADALFLTNSLRLVSPMTLSGKAASADVPEALSALMEGLCTAIAETCGKDPRSVGATLP